MRIRKRIDESRDSVVAIRVSQTEKQRLNELARDCGVSVGAYLIGLALGNGFVDGSAEVSGGKSDPAQVSIGGF